MATSSSKITGALSLSVGDSEPVQIATFEVPIKWTLASSPYGPTATADTSELAQLMKRVAGAVTEALDPEAPAEPEGDTAEPEGDTAEPEAAS